MRLRIAFIGGVACAALGAIAPAAARADETRGPDLSFMIAEARAAELARPRIFLTTSEALALTRPALPAPFAPIPQEVRLSQGAKTAIIVGAIVVGVLVLVGAVVLVGPGKKHL